MNSSSDSVKTESTTIVISPLNALMNDQIGKLAYLGVILLDGSSEKNQLAESLMKSGKLQVIFAHPEVLIDDKRVKKMLKSSMFQQHVKALVVDEAHLVDEWKTFRPAFSKLSVLCSIFPKVPIVALTATSTPLMKTKITDSIGLDQPVIIEVNPDRPNIYFESKERPNKKEERNNVLLQYVNELKEKRSEMPLTIFYGNLECCAESFMFFSSEMGNEQYEPIGTKKLTENRLFTQYHAQYPKYELERIMEQLVSGKCKHRIFFVTVAFGIGIDCSEIRQVVHLGVPLTMEEYYQEAGRAGRDGLPAKATLYYNSYDVSTARKGIQDVMIAFAKSSTSQCKRAIILNYFGHSPPQRTDGEHNCCDFHKSSCKCSVCDDAKILEAVSNVNLNDTLISSSQKRRVNQTKLSSVVPETRRKMLEEKLLEYRSSLGSNRSCVGSISFSTGFSMQLIKMVVEQCDSLNSVEDILENLPVFSEENATAIFNMLQEVLS